MLSRKSLNGKFEKRWEHLMYSNRSIKMSTSPLIRHSWHLSIFAALSLTTALYSAEYEAKPADAAFAQFQALKAPAQVR